MMNKPPFNTLQKIIVILFASLVLVSSCQDDSLQRNQQLDEDMTEAVARAEKYMNTEIANGRLIELKMAVTVLRYVDGTLYYATNTDVLTGYREVTEETVTAYTEPGESIFWFAGEGVSEISGIEFDEASQAELDEQPEDVLEKRMWKVTLPDQVSADGVTLKYDILYKTYANTGEVVRLDPKIKVSQ